MTDATTHRQLSDAVSWAREILDAPVVLAGGAVRDTLTGRTPKDWDLFYLDADPETVRQAFRAVCVDTSRGFQRHQWLAAEARAPFGLAQIFTTPATSPREILDRTDWNVSAFTFDGAEILATPELSECQPGCPLRLYRTRNAISTLARGFRLSDRLDMILETADVVKLCAIVSGGTKPRRPPRLRGQINALR